LNFDPIMSFGLLATLVGSRFGCHGNVADVWDVAGVVQHYAWGDADYIPSLINAEPDGRPWAELWLGTHPNGATHLADGRLLADLTGQLPYLLKVLAVAHPLSLQTHPNLAQAVDGFQRGIFPDPNPKPELLCAVTPFEALCGVRPVDATLALLHELGIHAAAGLLASDGVGAVVEALYRGSLDAHSMVAACSSSERREARWVCRLDAMYPGEPSVAVTLLLNLVALAPGQALRLDAGNLHAYLGGVGIELMGPSDNVVRGGLTSKPVDVDELLLVFDPTPLDVPVLPEGDRYELPAAGVALLRLDSGARHVATGHELSIDLAGHARYAAPGDELVASTTTYIVTPL
jgi:mannose-6-phosphate isomerase